MVSPADCFIAVIGCQPKMTSLLAVYRDMKLDLLTEGTDHGTRETREIVKSKSRC
jgi:hypothetical protein